VALRAAWEYFREVYQRYRKATRTERGELLDEFSRVLKYNRKYATRVLNGPPPERRPPRRKRRPRGPEYSERTISVLAAIWEAAGYPWSARLKALLPLWLPWAKRRYAVSSETERQLEKISARQMDRRLAPHKRRVRRRIYGGTKPGTLLKHQIPIKTDHWDVKGPGSAEIDLVSHSGSSAAGEFLHSLNLTDIHTTWVETRAVFGKGQTGVHAAIEDIRSVLPFTLSAIDTDNGSEFINAHLFRYCKKEGIQFTRGRPYKKDDNAHIEQKNWTHVRKLLGWERYDSEAALAAINALYTGDLRLLQNLFLPSVKLIEKKRVGSRLVRRYDVARTPLDRVAACPEANAERVAHLLALRAGLDPFRLSASVEAQLDDIDRLADRRRAPSPSLRTMEAAAPDGKAVDAPTAARPPAFPQGLGERCALPTSSTARTDCKGRKKRSGGSRQPTRRKATPTPSRAKPVDGPSKRPRTTPPTAFRRRKPKTHAKRIPKAARVTSQMARR
jgi:hypothetical protein